MWVPTRLSTSQEILIHHPTTLSRQSSPHIYVHLHTVRQSYLFVPRYMKTGGIIIIMRTGGVVTWFSIDQPVYILRRRKIFPSGWVDMF